MKKRGAVITTDRLVLRPLTPDDWGNFIERVVEADECLLQFGIEPGEELREVIKEPCTDQVVYYTIVLAETDEIIGYIGLAPKSDNLEFYIFADHRRNGYAFEAIRAFINSCVEGVITGKSHKRFIAETIHDNEPCIALLTKLGFKECRAGFNIGTGLGILGFKYAAG